jgi:mediator of RNA polymerase II transcription subunit 7
MLEHNIGSQLPHPPIYFKSFSIDAPTQQPNPPRPQLIKDEYTMFGATYRVSGTLPSLVEQGVQDLHYDEMEMKEHPVPTMKALLRSLLRQYIQLLDVLTKEDASQYSKHVEQIRTMFIHMHHALNSYRPREAIEMIKGWLRESRNFRDRACEELAMKMKEVLQIMSNEEGKIVKVKDDEKMIQ